MAWVARVSAKMRVMKERPQNQPRMTVPSSARPMATSSCRCRSRRERERFVGRLLDDDDPGQVGDDRACGVHLATVSVPVYAGLELRRVGREQLACEFLFL